VNRTRILALCAATAAALLFTCAISVAQQSSQAVSPSDAAVRDLADQVSQLRAMVEQMRAENQQSRAEMRQLRQELQDTRRLLTPLATAASAQPASPSDSIGTNLASVASNPGDSAGTSAPADLGSRVQKLEESTQLLGSKIDEQYQTKVETASKYRARLSGIVLMNLFHNVGAADNFDIPNYATPVAPGVNQASLGATLRQTEIGLEVFGPAVAGAKTSANVVFDFAGGFPSTNNGVNFGIVRMQTASLRFDWQHTSLIAGQDSLFFSPLSPTSFASLSTPAFGYAGNLWGWTPQLRLEHRFDLAHDQTLTLSGGILDNLDWEPPSDPYNRSPQAGEQSGQPAYAFRTAWSHPAYSHPLTLAVAGYYGRQNWAWGRYVDAWAAMTDWQIPIVRRLNLSGEFYRGRAVGGLGAGIGQTILFGDSSKNPFAPIRGVNSAGGWSQLKFLLTSKFELNGAFGEDDAFTGDIRGFATDANNFGELLGRNKGALGNFVYRPRSDLLISAEFRRLHTFPVYQSASTTNQLNLAMGVLF